MASNNGDNTINRDTENLSSASSINRVSIKVPAFIPTDPELWFLMLESIFDIAGITQDSTKFCHPLDALNQRYILEVRDVLVRPRGEQSYELLKTELIKRLGEQNTRRRLENEPLGDRKPSQFLRHLRGLAGIGCPEDVLQTVWLERLPKNMQAVLAAHRDLTLDKRAEIADSIAEIYGLSGNIAETKVTASILDQLDSLVRMMIAILQKLAAIEINVQGAHRSTCCGTSRSRSQSRSRSRSRSRHSGTSSEICWYHWQFGDQARNCERPCKYNAGSSRNDQGSR